MALAQRETSVDHIERFATTADAEKKEAMTHVKKVSEELSKMHAENMRLDAQLQGAVNNVGSYSLL